MEVGFEGAELAITFVFSGEPGMPETFALREYHEFEQEEYLEDVAPGSPSTSNGFVKPFEREAALDLYLRHLPLEHDPDIMHPWREHIWQDVDWMWGGTRLSVREAMFWFLAMTLPERHDDTRIDPAGVQVLRQLDLDAALATADIEQATARMRTWFDEARRQRGGVRWFSHAYLSRLLTEIFESEALLEALFSVIPGAEVRHFFTHLRVDEQELASASMRARIEHHVEMIPVERSEEDAYVAVRLLEKFPVEDAALALCERVARLPERSPFLVRDSVNLLKEKRHFVKWFNEMSDYHIAREAIPTIVLRGGMDVVQALTQRVARQPDDFLSAAFKDLLRLHTWRAVDGMLSLVDRSPFGRAARDWLISNAAHTVYRLLPVWLDHEASCQHALIQNLLEEICARGHVEILEQFARELPEEERVRVHETFAEYSLSSI